MIKRVDRSRSEALAKQIRAEFREMPGMCVTTAQAARLWQLSREGAELVLSEFVRAGFLVRIDRQHYRLPEALPASSKA